MIQAARFVRFTLRMAVLALGLFASSTSHALSGVAVELGHGDNSTESLRINPRWDWDKRWSLGQGWIAHGFWEANAGYLQGDRAGGEDIWDIGLTPVFRLRSGLSRFYLEGAIGVHFLSKTRVNNGRGLGSSFQFGDHIGFGWNFGTKDRYDLGYRFQHISNADIKDPNNGLNLHLFRLGYNY